MSDNWIATFVVGGGGTVLGSVITAFIQSMGSRGRDRAEAADKSVTAASKIIDRLTIENIEMRKAIVAITEVLDDMIDDLPMDNLTKAKLRKINKVAKMAAI